MLKKDNGKRKKKENNDQQNGDPAKKQKRPPQSLRQLLIANKHGEVPSIQLCNLLLAHSSVMSNVCSDEVGLYEVGKVVNNALAALCSCDWSHLGMY